MDQHLKMKKEKKKKASDYLAFYKYYYSKLSSEHPRWNSAQITTIIKLLWKKRSKAGKLERTKKIKRFSTKVLSGWQCYRKEKESEGFTRNMIKDMWKGLPLESKRYFKIKGLGRELKKKKTSGAFVRKILNRGAVKPEFPF